LHATVRPTAPKGATFYTTTRSTNPCNRHILMAGQLQQLQLELGLARPPIQAHQPPDSVTVYIGAAHADIKPHLTKTLEETSDPLQRASFAALQSIEQGRLVLNALMPGARAARRADKTYAPLREVGTRMLQRTFMTSALVHDIKAVSPNQVPLAPEAELFLQQTAGLYGLLHEQGLQPYSFAELGTIALCSTDIPTLNDLQLTAPLDRAALLASV